MLLAISKDSMFFRCKICKKVQFWEATLFAKINFFLKFFELSGQKEPAENLRGYFGKS